MIETFKKIFKLLIHKNMDNNLQEFSGTTPVSSLTRERSFIRTPHQQKHQNKRRSLAFNHQHEHLRIKPAIEIYRPPSEIIPLI